MTDCGLCRIELDHVSVSAGGEKILTDVTMHIHCGEITALVGPNGAGKTTLIRALLSLLPYTGVIQHLDTHARRIPRLRTGYVPQTLDFDKDMPITVRDLIASSLTRRPVWLGISARVRAAVNDALRMAEADTLAGKRLGSLSGGELQRVLLALSLTPTPDLLVLDEPVSGVDQNGLKLFLDTVQHLRSDHHMAILLVSHDFSLVRQYADSVILLNGRVLRSGKPEDVFASDEFRTSFPAYGEVRI